MTVIEVIQRSTDFLAKKGVESSRLQVELLLAHLLKLPRMKLYLNFDRVLTEGELTALREFVKRRGQREPLQHIVGSTSFCGWEMLVNPHVLIPRPETEMLAERAWNHLSPLPPLSSVLDFGTGSGCLAIALAVKCPATAIYAVDISPAALQTAQANATRHQVSERIHFHLGDGFSALPPNIKFSLIVSNPPYIPSAEIATLEPEVRDFDPKLALDGGTDGLDFYRRLAQEARGFLQPNGKIMLEFGAGQSAAIRLLFEAQNWQVQSIDRDDTQRERFLTAFALD